MVRVRVRASVQITVTAAHLQHSAILRYIYILNNNNNNNNNNVIFAVNSTDVMLTHNHADNSSLFRYHIKSQAIFFIFLGINPSVYARTDAPDSVVVRVRSVLDGETPRAGDLFRRGGSRSKTR